MAVTIPITGGTIAAVNGETYIVQAGTTGPITFTGNATFTVDVVGNLTGVSNIDNARAITFGAGTDPTVNFAAGIDSTPYNINADGDTLTVNVGDGASIGTINADSVSSVPGFTLNVGENVNVFGSIDGPSAVTGVGATYTIGNNFTATGDLIGASFGPNTMTIGDGLDVSRLTAAGNGTTDLVVGNDASISNAVDLRGTGDRNATFGDNLKVVGGAGNIDMRAVSGDHKLVIGDGATISNDINLAGGLSSIVNIGQNLSVGGNFVTTSGVDNVTVGNNWFVNGNLDVLGGNDQVALGYQAGTDPTIVFGNGGTDGLTVAAPPGQEAAFILAATNAGWTDNGDGTVSGATGAGSFVFGGHTYLSWEGPGNPICFTAGTQIEVANGETVAVEDLRQGDMVMTADNGLQPVKWIGTNTFGAEKLEAEKNMRPIRIKAGALGGGMPVRDLLVSPQHRMLVRSTIAQKMFGEDEILVAAKHLVLIDGIDVADDVTEVTYVHFLCDRHEVVFANGAASESLYTGPQALKSVSPAAVAEIMALFPELADVDYKALSARKMVNGRMGRQLAVRHKNKQSPLLATRH